MTGRALRAGLALGAGAVLIVGVSGCSRGSGDDASPEAAPAGAASAAAPSAGSPEPPRLTRESAAELTRLLAARDPDALSDLVHQAPEKSGDMFLPPGTTLEFRTNTFQREAGALGVVEVQVRGTGAGRYRMVLSFEHGTWRVFGIRKFPLAGG